MTDARRARCKVCRKHRDEAGELTWNGYCIDCAKAAVESNVEQMQARSGPNFTLWRRRMAASVGAVLLDDVTGKP